MNEEKTTKKFLENRDVLKWVIIGLAEFVIIILVFGAGMKIGTLKARYSYGWAENYHRNFAGPRGGFLGDFRHSFEDTDLINAHGTFGSIITIDGSTLIIKGDNDVEKTVTVASTTKISSGHETIKIGDLKVDDKVTIIGSPNEQGQIEAKLIRIFR